MAKDKQKKHESAEEKAASGKMKRKEFEKELAKLQVELVRLQTWVRAKHARVIVVFEGRDTAGKGGVISRITARTSPRVYRHIALPTPSDREKTQVYIQRYIAHFPAAGEIILFDRSWYNRAGVERVMGFCTEEQCERFLTLVPTVEQEMISRNGIILRKYFLDVSQDEQRRRFEARIKDPVKHWKLSPMDTESVRRWWDYTAAYQRMIKATHTPEAPWYPQSLLSNAALEAAVQPRLNRPANASRERLYRYEELPESATKGRRLLCAAADASSLRPQRQPLKRFASPGSALAGAVFWRRRNCYGERHRQCH